MNLNTPKIKPRSGSSTGERRCYAYGASGGIVLLSAGVTAAQIMEEQSAPKPMHPRTSRAMSNYAKGAGAVGFGLVSQAVIEHKLGDDRDAYVLATASNVTSTASSLAWIAGRRRLAAGGYIASGLMFLGSLASRD